MPIWSVPGKTRVREEPPCSRRPTQTEPSGRRISRVCKSAPKESTRACPTSEVAPLSSSAAPTRWRAASRTKGKNPGRMGRSVHSRSTVVVSNKTRPLPTSRSTSAGAPLSKRRITLRRAVSRTGSRSMYLKKRADSRPSPSSGKALSKGARRSRGKRRSAGRSSTVAPACWPGSAAAVPGQHAGETVDERPAERLLPLDRRAPLLSAFPEEGDGLLSARFFKYMLLDPVRDTARRNVILRFESGAPALVERDVGKGRVLLLTTTVDREWTDLPIRPGFLPLVREAARHLVGAADEESGATSLVGQARVLSFGADLQTLE